MAPTPEYVEHPPPPGLRDVVACFWTTRGVYPPGTSLHHRVLPDGCMDVLVDVGAGRADVIGTMTRALEVRQSGPVDLLGVRFRPGAAPAFLGLPADECVDGREDLAEVWGVEAARLLDALLETPDAAERLTRLARTLETRRPGASVDRLVGTAVRRLDRRPTPSVEALADGLGVSRRTLERRFRTAVGLSPWQLARVARLQRAVACILTDPGDLSGAAHATGFHDQPHMNREFREMVGLPPGAWLEERRTAVASVQDTTSPGSRSSGRERAATAGASLSPPFDPSGVSP